MPKHFSPAQIEARRALMNAINARRKAERDGQRLQSGEETIKFEYIVMSSPESA